MLQWLRRAWAGRLQLSWSRFHFVSHPAAVRCHCSAVTRTRTRTYSSRTQTARPSSPRCTELISETSTRRTASSAIHPAATCCPFALPSPCRRPVLCSSSSVSCWRTHADAVAHSHKRLQTAAGRHHLQLGRLLPLLPFRPPLSSLPPLPTMQSFTCSAALLVATRVLSGPPLVASARSRVVRIFHPSR